MYPFLCENTKDILKRIIAGALGSLTRKRDDAPRFAFA